MFQVNKRIWIVSGLIAVLLLAGVLNYRVNSPADGTEASAQLQAEEPEAEEASASFFADFRTERTTVRNQEIAYLDSIILSEASDAETVAAAQAQKMEIAGAMEKEVTVEGLLRARGITDAVVTCHAGSVNVVVNEESLTDAQVAQVLELVQRETGESAENIKIIPVQ